MLLEDLIVILAMLASPGIQVEVAPMALVENVP